MASRIRRERSSSFNSFNSSKLMAARDNEPATG